MKEYDINQVSGIGFRTGEDLAYRGEELINGHVYLVIYPHDNSRTDIYDTYSTSIEFAEDKEEKKVEFKWQKIDPMHALLIGPEAGEVAAVVVLDPGDPELGDGEWKVMSSDYRSLNFTEANTSLALEKIQRQTIIRLGQELEKRKRDIEDAISSILSMVFAEEGV